MRRRLTHALLPLALAVASPAAAAGKVKPPQ
jgi:hypothetical protein